MRDFRDAKTMAQTLRAALAVMGFKITVSQSLELIAQAFGVADWNTLSAALRAQATPVPGNAARPSPTVESAKTAGSAPNTLSPDPLSDELKTTLNQAFAYAKGRGHEAITVEHLLFFLLDDADASRVLKACGVNLDDLRKNLSDYLDKNPRVLAIDGADNPRPALGFQRVLQRAVFHVQQAGHFPVKSLNVLVAIFSESQSHAVKLLTEQGVIRIEVLNYITHGLVKGAEGPTDRPAGGSS
jgi:hypothetical protein